MSGRGRGRGRGRGSGRVGPIIRDDDGKVVFAKKLEGPPPLYPILETLPERPDITQKENTYLVEKRRLLHTFWNESAYYIEPVKDSSSGVDADIRQTSRKPLALYLQLTSAFFPAELIGHAERKRKRNNQEGMWTLQNSAKSDLGRLDKLASLEQKIGQKGEKDEGEKKEGEEDEEDQDATFEEDEEDIVEDDYMANFGFDDDDEYDDDDAGGEDEGPTY